MEFARVGCGLYSLEWSMRGDHGQVWSEEHLTERRTVPLVSKEEGVKTGKVLLGEHGLIDATQCSVNH